MHSRSSQQRGFVLWGHKAEERTVYNFLGKFSILGYKVAIRNHFYVGEENRLDLFYGQAIITFLNIIPIECNIFNPATPCGQVSCKRVPTKRIGGEESGV